MSSAEIQPRTVVVTGAAGNVGRKVVEALATHDWCASIIGVDLSEPRHPYSAPAQARLRFVTADLTRNDEAWQSAMAAADTVVHVAAVNPVPDCMVAEAVASFGMTSNVALWAARCDVRRLIFASSNHVMGGYKDAPLAAGMGPGKLTTDLEPAPGTRWHNGTAAIDSVGYGYSKLMGERLCATVAEQSGGQLTTVSIRIGWTQVGDNHPSSISHAGTPASGVIEAPATLDGRLALRWFRNMWLSNADLARLFTAAVQADPSRWPTPAVVINGTSDNRAMDWDLASARTWIGYHPQDDIYDHVDG